MKKFGHEPPPLDMMLNRIAGDLIHIFPRNGYPNIGFTLIVQLLDGTDEVAMSGNLRPDGLRALLQNALSTLPPEAANESEKQ